MTVGSAYMCLFIRGIPEEMSGYPMPDRIARRVCFSIVSER